MSRKKSRRLILGLLLLLLAMLPVSLSLGRYPIGLGEVWHILTGRMTEGTASGVFFTLRLPRTIMALLAGAGLSLAGFVYQTLFKNLLAAPDIIGVASGANAGVAVGMVFFAGKAFLIPVCAFVGGRRRRWRPCSWRGPPGGAPWPRWCFRALSSAPWPRR